MKKWKLVVGVALVFVLGLLAGSMGTGLYMKNRFPPPKKDPSEMRAFILERFSQKVDLTEEQKKKFKVIIDQVGEKLDEHFRKTHSEIGKIVEPGFSQMREVLSPDQQEKFDELIERIERHRKEGPKHGPPGPPPRPR
jgi:Spy/CpxP family protein refolding chaperone